MDCYSPNSVNSQKNYVENLTISSEFDNILIYMFIFISKIFSLLKKKLRKENNLEYFLIRKYNQIKLLYNKNEFLEVKYESKVKLIIKEIKDDNNDINGIHIIKKRKYNINRNNIIIRHYIIIIKLILIYIFCQIKSNKYDIFYFLDSKITLKTKGIGEYNIIGKDELFGYMFQGINHLKEVKINEDIKQPTTYKYNFILEDIFC